MLGRSLFSLHTQLTMGASQSYVSDPDAFATLVIGKDGSQMDGPLKEYDYIVVGAGARVSLRIYYWSVTGLQVQLDVSLRHACQRT